MFFRHAGGVSKLIDPSFSPDHYRYLRFALAPKLTKDWRAVPPFDTQSAAREWRLSTGRHGKSVKQLSAWFRAAPGQAHQSEKDLVGSN